MKVVVLGCGRVGYAAALNLVKWGYNVTVADVDARRINYCRASLKNVEAVRLDVKDLEAVRRLVKGFRLVCCTLPGSLSFNVLRLCLSLGLKVVDTSFTPEDQLKLNDEAERTDSLLIPDCGFAPGLTNLLAGRIAASFNQVEELAIYVGGLPLKPLPPLNYALTWSTEDLIEEYVREARIMVNGETRKVDPLSSIGSIHMEGVGSLEFFYSDGLRTLLKTLRNVKNMYEATLRYPGHLNAMLLLKRLGLLSDTPIEVDGLQIRPKRFLAKLLEANLPRDVEDVVVMKVEAVGIKDGLHVKERFIMIERFDAATGLTAMARVTGGFCAVIAKLVAEGTIKGRGVIPPELIGMDEQLYSRVMEGMVKAGIHVKKL
ncbi:MAG: saccharopine dehydrogenase C-terminal domain-containing protein [Candidatus Nezhaarchaeales archaeon]